MITTITPIQARQTYDSMCALGTDAHSPDAWFQMAENLVRAAIVASGLPSCSPVILRQLFERADDCRDRAQLLIEMSWS